MRSRSRSLFAARDSFFERELREDGTCTAAGGSPDRFCPLFRGALLSCGENGGNGRYGTERGLGGGSCHGNRRSGKETAFYVKKVEKTEKFCLTRLDKKYNIGTCLMLRSPLIKSKV